MKNVTSFERWLIQRAAASTGSMASRFSLQNNFQMNCSTANGDIDWKPPGPHLRRNVGAYLRPIWSSSFGFPALEENADLAEPFFPVSPTMLLLSARSCFSTKNASSKIMDASKTCPPIFSAALVIAPMYCEIRPSNTTIDGSVAAYPSTFSDLDAWNPPEHSASRRSATDSNRSTNLVSMATETAQTSLHSNTSDPLENEYFILRRLLDNKELAFKKEKAGAFERIGDTYRVIDSCLESTTSFPLLPRSHENFENLSSLILLNGYQASRSGRAQRDAAALAMQGWHEQRLLRYGLMVKFGVKKPQERADLIAYLKESTA
nr:hypothetical protein Iba_chr04aCG20740 [Ipomoea batatas]